MPTELRRLSLIDFRRSVFDCNECFEQPAVCLHHEDVLGGFNEGRIAVVGVNPQASPGDEVYQKIQAAPWQDKLRLSDLLLQVFAGHRRFEDIHPDWAWMANHHRGLTEWLPRVAGYFGVSRDDLANRFVFLEAFKHATKDQGALTRDHKQWQVIKEACPRLLEEQLVRLRPRLLVLCGSSGKNIVAPLLLDRDAASRARQSSMERLHGTVFGGRVGDMPVDILFTLAISRQTVGAWRAHPNNETIRRILAGA